MVPARACTSSRRTSGRASRSPASTTSTAACACPRDSPLRVGDLVSFGISHPCTTFDKWRLLYVVDDDYTVTEAIRTFF